MSDVVPLHRRPQPQVCFDRAELSLILNVYGHMVGLGEWRDYAIDPGTERCTFSVFRRASEEPLYRIEKIPALRARQGQFRVVAPGGLILKRGHDLKAVLRVFDRQRFRAVK